MLHELEEAYSKTEIVRLHNQKHGLLGVLRDQKFQHQHGLPV